jgi:hypothetical protein
LCFRQFGPLGIDKMLRSYLAHEVVGKESVVEEGIVCDEVDF